MSNVRKKRRLLFRRKRTLDPNIVIDYKNPDILKRFVTDRGKIIPRRISGATASQQRAICPRCSICSLWFLGWDFQHPELGNSSGYVTDVFLSFSDSVFPTSNWFLLLNHRREIVEKSRPHSGTAKQSAKTGYPAPGVSGNSANSLCNRYAATLVPKCYAADGIALSGNLAGGVNKGKRNLRWTHCRWKRKPVC